MPKNYHLVVNMTLQEYLGKNIKRKKILSSILDK